MTARPDRYAVTRRKSTRRIKGRPRNATYTADEILDAIRRWHKEHDTPPRSDDWDPARAERMGHPDRAARFRAGNWPSTRMVRRQFPTFGAAIAAAGFDAPSSPGTKPRLEGPHEVLRAIRAWTRRYGEPPTQSDWDPTRARANDNEWRVVRYRTGDWPSLQTARKHFGTLSAAVRAAGLEPPTRWEPLDEAVKRQLHNAAVVVAEDAGEFGPSGPGLLAGALRGVAAARAAEDEVALRAALLDVATAATRWANVVPWAAVDTTPTTEPTHA